MTNTESLVHQADLANVPGHGTGSEFSQSQASSTSTDSQSASEPFSPSNGLTSMSDASPQSPPNCTATLVSTSVVNTEPSSFPAVSESEGSNVMSTSTRKMNLNDYRLHRTKLSITTPDHNCNTSMSPKWKDGLCRSETNSVPSELTAESVNSTLKLSSASKSTAKPRMKLKIGSEVVVKAFFSPVEQSSDVPMSDKVNKVVSSSNSLPEKWENCTKNSLSACVNGDESDKLNLHVNSSLEICGHASSNGCSCVKDRSDWEPPSKQARMSFNGQFSSAGDMSACQWVHHD